MRLFDAENAKMLDDMTVFIVNGKVTNIVPHRR